MIVLLTGSTGFVGKHVKARLERDGHTVVPYHRSQILSSHTLGPLDAIIHCAGEISDQSRMFEANVMLTHEVLQFAQQAGIRKVVHIGSSSEYGKTNLPRYEHMVCTPACLYDSTKLAATALCQGFAAQFDMDVCVARPFSLYGPGDTPRKLVPRLLAAHREKRAMDLYEGGGHDWIYVDDFVDGLMTLLVAPREATKGEVFNFGTAISSSNLDVLKAMEEAVGAQIPVNLKQDTLHRYDTDVWVADIEKAEGLGWQPRWSLKDGIAEYVRREQIPA